MTEFIVGNFSESEATLYFVIVKTFAEFIPRNILLLKVDIYSTIVCANTAYK